MKKFRIKSWTYFLIILNTIIFIFEMIFPQIVPEFDLKSDILSRPWILITYMFLHATPEHLIFNMYALLIFGILLENKIGSKNFVKIYFTSGIIAGIVGSFIYNSALGASAAIMGIIGATVVLMPDLPILLFFIIPMSMRTAGILWFLLDLIGAFSPNSHVGHIAHIVGMTTGLVFGYYYKKKIYDYQKPFRVYKKNNKEDFLHKKFITIEDIDEITK